MYAVLATYALKFVSELFFYPFSKCFISLSSVFFYLTFERCLGKSRLLSSSLRFFFFNFWGVLFFGKIRAFYFILVGVCAHILHTLCRKSVVVLILPPFFWFCNAHQPVYIMFPWVCFNLFSLGTLLLLSDVSAFVFFRVFGMQAKKRRRSSRTTFSLKIG